MGNRRLKSIEQLFNKYMLLVGLSHLEENSIQYKETKKAFIAGAYSMHRMLTVDLCELDDKEAFKMLDVIQSELITLSKEANE